MEPAIFGPLDAVLAPVVEYVVLAVVLANLLTRFLAHRSYVRQADEDEDVDSLSRYWLHDVSNGLLVLVSFYYLTLHHHAGIVLSTLVIGTVIADVFEFEAREVEVRNDLPIERPNGALFASLLVFAYAAFLSLFFLVAPLWEQIV